MSDLLPQTAKLSPPTENEKPAKSREWIHAFIFEGVPTILILANLVLLFSEKKEVSSEIILILTLAFSNILLIVGNFHLNRLVSNYHKTRIELNSQIALNELENEYHESFVNRLLLDAHQFNTQISQNRMQIAYAHTRFCADIMRFKDGERGIHIDQLLGSYLSDVLNTTSQLFGRYTKHDCASCIKIFEGGFGDTKAEMPITSPPFFVRTLLRDSMSNSTRSAVDKKLDRFDYHNNTAFLYIYSHRGEPDYYVANDLRERAASHQFHCERANWLDDYDAMAVVPIRPHGDPVDVACIGFLCVDNKGGNFDADRCVNILNGITSDLYFGIFLVKG